MGVTGVAPAIVVAVATTVAVALSGCSSAPPAHAKTASTVRPSATAPHPGADALAIGHAQANSQRAANACRDDRTADGCSHATFCSARCPAPANPRAAAGLLRGAGPYLHRAASAKQPTDQPIHDCAHLPSQPDHDHHRVPISAIVRWRCRLIYARDRRRPPDVDALFKRHGIVEEEALAVAAASAPLRANPSRHG